MSLRARVSGAPAAARRARHLAALRRSAEPATALPLSALRDRHPDEERAHWDVDVGGFPGRALVSPARVRTSFPLRLGGDVLLRGRVALISQDWSNGRSAIAATVFGRLDDGSEQVLWSGRVGSADDGADREGVAVDCAVPHACTELTLHVDRAGAALPLTVGRAIWVDMHLLDPLSVPVTEARTHPARAGTRDDLPLAARQPVGSPDRPLISVLTPVHDPPLEMLQEAVDSVRHQGFADWELCLVDDGSSRPEIIAALDGYAAADARIRLQRHPRAGGISAATNTALAMARGDFIALLDHDDTLEPDVLHQIARHLRANPTVDALYTDESIIENGRTIARHRKSGWAPEHMEAHMYTCHLGVYRRTIAETIGGFRSEFDGSQDYDFFLRFVEHSDRLEHLPLLGYNWRAHAASTASTGGDAKPWAYLAGARVIADHLERTGVDAEVAFGPALGLYQVRHRVAPATTVELITAVADVEAAGLEQCALSWSAITAPAWRVTLAAPEAEHAACAAALAAAGVPEERVSLLDWSPAQGIAAGLDAGARASDAEQLVLMSAPVLGLTNDWLERVVGFATQAGIAAAPLVVDSDGRILHAGIALPSGLPLHLLYGSLAEATSPVVWNLRALGGVVALARETYTRVGGLRPEFEPYALADLTVRLTADGGRAVQVPHARVLAPDGRAPVNDLPAIWRLCDAWLQHGESDPYYSRHFRSDRGDYRPWIRD